MKKILLIAAVIILAATIGGSGYWYWHNQPEKVVPLQQVALDHPDITSFDDVCTEKDEYELECKGNIEQFGCEHYRGTSALADLQPSYPMLICEKQYDLSQEGLYRIEKQVPLGPRAYKYVDYIIIKDNTFQRIQSEDQFRQLFQPIGSAEEAAIYFEALHKAFLILRNEQLSGFKYLEKIGDVKGTFYIPSGSIGLSKIQKAWNGYTITAYSSYGGSCVDEIYRYQYLLKENGHLIEKSKQLIWESKSKPACIN